MAGTLAIDRPGRALYDITEISLRGIEIPMAARIFAVADVFDAMANDQPYRNALDLEQTREEIRARAGLDFDPDVVEGFLALEQLAAQPAEQPEQ